jgi:lipopolysaccharide cholinephosphotransferase
MRISNPYLSAVDKERVKNYSGRDPKEIINAICKEAKVYNGIDTEYVAPYCFTLYDIKKQTFRKEDLFDTVTVDFETIKVPIPRNSDLVLRKLYGNYMDFPSIDKRGCEQHNGAVFDMDIPYKDKLQMIYDEDRKR